MSTTSVSSDVEHKSDALDKKCCSKQEPTFVIIRGPLRDLINFALQLALDGYRESVRSYAALVRVVTFERVTILYLMIYICALCDVGLETSIST